MTEESGRPTTTSEATNNSPTAGGTNGQHTPAGYSPIGSVPRPSRDPGSDGHPTLRARLEAERAEAATRADTTAAAESVIQDQSANHRLESSPERLEVVELAVDESECDELLERARERVNRHRQAAAEGGDGPVGENGQSDEPSAVSATDADDVAQRLEDAHIGAYLADHYLSDYVYAVGLGWLKFDDRRWAKSSPEDFGEAIRLAVIEFHRTQAKAEADVRRLQRIDGLLSAVKLRALQSIARNRLSRRAEEFDNHPDLLNVGNGVVDLRDGTLRPHDRELLLTRVTPVDYVPGAEYVDWLRALTALSADAASWMQVRLGQGLTGHPTPDDRLPVLKGSGSNGKTTLIDAARHAVGDEYAVTMPERILLARMGDHPTELMELRGARLAVMEEFPELGHLNVKRLKDLLGTGRLSARYCRQDTVSWSPTHSPFVSTNYTPRVDESDHGTWRRLALVEFPFRFVGSEEEMRTPFDRLGDPNLRERLRHGNDGQPEAVLSWLVEGAGRWYRAKRLMPADPPCIREATERWRRTADLILRYIYDRIVFDAAFYVASSDLYKDFSDWLDMNGHRSWTDQSFGARWAQHSEVTEHEVVKKIVRQSQPGNLSRPSSWAKARATERPLGNQFTAWLGVRFRTEADEEERRDE